MKIPKQILQHIRRQNTEKILSILKISILKNANPCELTDDTGATLLHFAAKFGNVWFTKHLIKLGANVDALNTSRETPLMFAVKYYQTQIVEVLLQAGADMYLPNQLGQCALGRVFSNEAEAACKDMALQRHITRESLSKSKHVNRPTFHNDCPLHYFVPLNDVDVIRVLLEKGSPVDAKRPDTGETSLHLSVKQMNFEIVKVLLSYNANVNIKSDVGDTPMYYLRDFKNQKKALEIFQSLIEAGAILGDYGHRKIYVKSLLHNGNKQIIHSLVNYQKDLDFWYFEDEYGNTPLHLLAQNKYTNILTELQDLNFYVDIPSSLNNSMLHYAALSGNDTSIKFLLDRGADVNATNLLGCTPLSYMIKENAFNRTFLSIGIKCIEILLSGGADPQFVTAQNSDWYQFVTFRKPIYVNVIKIMHPVITYLSLLEKSGKSINQYTREVILSVSEFKEIFDIKNIELAEMKEIELAKSVSVFDFLIASDKKISLYARYRQLVPSSLSKVKTYDTDFYYHRKLCKNCLKFDRLVALRRTYAITLNTIIGKLCNISVYEVAEKIVEYLEDYELNQNM